MDFLWDLSKGTFWGSAFAAVFLTAFFFAAPLTEGSSRRSLRFVVLKLLGERWRARYRDALGGLLDRLDRAWSRREAGLPATSAPRAWSFGLLNFTLAFALGYPLASLAANWGLFGDGAVAGLVVLPNVEPRWLQGATIGVVALSFAAVLYTELRLEGLRRRVMQSVAVGLAGAVAGAVAAAAKVAGADAVAVAGAGAGAGGVAGGVAVAGAVAGVGAGAGAGAGAVAGAVAVAFAGALAVERLTHRASRPSLILGSWAALGFAAACIAVSLAPSLQARAALEPAGAILFLGLLPLINGAADFLSFGLTRWCLRLGLAGRPWRGVVIDVLGAAVIFALLGMAMIATLHFVRPRDGAPLLDLERLFADIRGDPAGHWWLGFMMFSTLVPTVLHFSLFLLTAGFLAPRGLRRWIAANLVSGWKGDRTHGRLGAAALSLLTAAAVVGPAFAVWEGGALLLGSPGALISPMLDGFAGFACRIGAFCGPVAP